VDTTFIPGQGPENTPTALVVQHDGKILIGGGFTSYNNQSRTGIARLRPDASLDTSFNPVLQLNGVNNGSASAFAVQSDGKILIGGNFTSINGTNFGDVARLNTDGSLDTTFNPGTGASGGVNALGLQSNGQVIVGGNFTTMNGIPLNYLARLNTNGSVDTSFNAIIAGSSSVSSLVVTPQDKIILLGNFSSINGYSRPSIARLNADGSVDTTFNPNPGINPVKGATLQSDRKVVICGFGRGVARLNTDGSLDTTFNPGTGVSNSQFNFVLCVASQPDGKTVIGGGFNQFNGTNINYIARLNGDTSSTTLNLLSPQIYFGMNLSGVVSNSYRIEYTSQFNTPSLWTPLFNVMLQTNPQFILDPNPAGGQRFYRAVQVSP
jgi:uncharacterized delta-60 repeat protein